MEFDIWGRTGHCVSSFAYIFCIAMDWCRSPSWLLWELSRTGCPWNDGYSKLQKSLSILLHSTSKILGDGGASRDALSPSLFAALGAGCWRPWFRMKKMTRKRRYINTKASSKELKGIAGRNQLTIQSRIQCQMPDRQVVPKDEGQEVKASAKAWWCRLATPTEHLQRSSEVPGQGQFSTHKPTRKGGERKLHARGSHPLRLAKPKPYHWQQGTKTLHPGRLGSPAISPMQSPPQPSGRNGLPP